MSGVSTVPAFVFLHLYCSYERKNFRRSFLTSWFFVGGVGEKTKIGEGYLSDILESGIFAVIPEHAAEPAGSAFNRIWTGCGAPRA